MSKQKDNNNTLNGEAKPSQDEQSTICNIEKRKAYRMSIAGEKIKRNVVTEIGKFAILWNRFENLHCNNDCNPSKIKEIVNSISVDVEKMNIFRETLKNRIEILGEGSVYYIQQGLHPEGARKSSKVDRLYMEQFINNDSDQMNNIIGCLLIIQRIRNNMMHGLKDIHDLEGQLELFQAMNGVLEDL